MRSIPVRNPPNPYTSRYADLLEPPPQTRLEVYEETARSILSRNDSPDIPFTWSVNPYRGCQHACAYCYARCTHEYLGLGAGTDFDTKIVAKTNAPELLRQAFRRRSWNREPICFSGVTDCYQPIEAGYALTRRCLEVCLSAANPVGIVTKGRLILRDLDLLRELANRAHVRIHISIPFLDAETASRLEPQAPVPRRRFDTVRALADAGLHVDVMVAPVILGLNDREIPDILAAAAQAGARSACYVPLRLPGSAQAVFLERLAEAFPLRARRIEHHVRDMRGGALNDTRLGKRTRGQGTYWRSVQDLFAIAARRAGLTVAPPAQMPSKATRSRPTTVTARQTASPDRPAPPRPLQQPPPGTTQLTLPFDSPDAER